MGANNISNVVDILEQEVIDLKNNKRTQNMRNTNTTDGVGGNRVDLLIEEINQLWNFVQKFIDEQSNDMIQDVRSTDLGFKNKMNRMGWLARNSEYISPEMITKCLVAFKEQFNGTSLTARNTYISSKHNSNSIITVVNLIDHVSKLNRDEESISKLAILLSILEPLLINDVNLEQGLNMKTMEVLSSLLELPNYLLQSENVNQAKLPVYLKYTIRCITSCVRHPMGIDQMFFFEHGTGQIL